MTRPHIITAKMATLPADGRYDYELEALARLGAEIEEVPATEAAFLAAAPRADAVYAKQVLPLTAALVAGLTRCKLIACASVGVDYVDVAAATARGIPVTNCPDTFIEEVADHAMMLLLATHRRCIEQDRMVRQGRWREGRPQLNQIPRLMGSTLGLIAFGRVARQVARRAAPFGLRLMAYDPYVDELSMSALGVQPASLDEVLSQSDFVSMHAPDTAETQRMLGAAHFARMKPGAVFINTGRGPTVDEPALIAALQNGQIAAAGLDVLEREPPAPDNPLLGMSNVILSPHNASASARFDAARRRRVGQELALVLDGRWPMSCVNPTTLPGSGLRRWQPYAMDRGPNS